MSSCLARAIFCASSPTTFASTTKLGHPEQGVATPMAGNQPTRALVDDDRFDVAEPADACSQLVQRVAFRVAGCDLQARKRQVFDAQLRHAHLALAEVAAPPARVPPRHRPARCTGRPPSRHQPIKSGSCRFASWPPWGGLLA